MLKIHMLTKLCHKNLPSKGNITDFRCTINLKKKLLLSWARKTFHIYTRFTSQIIYDNGGNNNMYPF